MKKVFLVLFSVLFSVSLIFGGAVVEKVTGDVTKIDTAGSSAGLSANSPVIEGDKIITAKNSSAVVNLPDGSKLRVSEKTEFVLDEAKEDSVSADLKGGKIRAIVSKLSTRKKFDIKGPAVVCSVRGTEFEVAVDEKGKTTVHVFEGLVSARQIGGEEIMIHPNQKLSIEENMPPQFIQQTRAFQASQNLRQEVAKEVGLDMSRDQVQAAAALELRNAEYQVGKTFLDADGVRVRVDEYLIRPQDNLKSFKLVVMNDRENRFDYFTYKAILNKNLPQDLKTATANMYGSDTANYDTLNDYHVVSYEKGRANTDNKLKLEDYATGGTPMANPVGFTGWRTKFDLWGLKIGGTEKIRYDRNYTGGIKGNWKSEPDGFYEDVAYTLSGSLATKTAKEFDGVWYKEAKEDHTINKITFGDGTYYMEKAYYFDDLGKRVKIADVKNTLDWNNQVVFTATEFGDKDINLVIEPQIMALTGITR